MKIEREVVGTAAGIPFDAARLRGDFPILRERVRGKPLVYLDNGATTQKPEVVIDTLANPRKEERPLTVEYVWRASVKAPRRMKDAKVLLSLIHI